MGGAGFWIGNGKSFQVEIFSFLGNFLPAPESADQLDPRRETGATM